MADVWKEVSVKTIKLCFAKCGTTEQTSEDENDIVDEEFNAFFDFEISFLKNENLFLRQWITGF